MLYEVKIFKRAIMKKIILYSIFLMGLVSVAAAGDIEVKITGDRLSIHANQAPLQDILKLFVEQGIEVRIDPSINKTISASFTNRDIARGLDSILKTINHILVWKSIEGPAGSFERLAEIHVFQSGRKDLIKPLEATRRREVVREGKDGVLFIKDEILLGLKQGVNLDRFKKILETLGGTVLDSNPSIGIYRILLPENSDVIELIKEIRDIPDIGKAEPNYVYPITAPERNMGLNIALAPEYTPSYENMGAAPVAVMDTGISIIPDLEGLVVASLNSIDQEETISDSEGHGSQMALIASGVIKPYGVGLNKENLNPIIAIKAIDENGYISNFDIMRGIDFALQKGARVMSLSWGSETKSDFLEQDLKYAASKGLFIVASAGNEPTGRPVYPAAYGSVIGVGALDPDGGKWERSNYGDFVAVYAPGFAGFPIGYKGDPGTYAGTSISAAYFANLIANQLSQDPGASIQEIFRALEGD